jgi:DNA helicase-2/ATP-dependent DNA helicase PcrA
MTLSLTRSRPAPSPDFTLTLLSGEVITATPEQTAILRAAIDTTSSLCIEALAGSAKTTTIEFLCAHLPPQPVLCLAFNKRIAEEMAARLPGHVTCRTMNSIGHRIWSAACGRKLVLNTRKNYEILKALVEELPKPARSEAYDSFGETLKIIAKAKRDGFIPRSAPVRGGLVEAEAFWETCDDVPDSLTQSLVAAAILASIRASYAGTIDFDDQLYMPTLFGGSFPRFPLVMVDEWQDFSSINHAMLRKLVTGRLIAVGDPYQSIYGFRGAASDGMSVGKEHYRMASFPLSVSFRCPEAIVEAARFRVPHMQWRKPGGHVERLYELSTANVPDGAAFICRNNAPLFALAIRLLSRGRGVHLVGSDLGPSLIKTLKKLGPLTLTLEETLHVIKVWELARLAKTKNRAAAVDKADCLRVFAQFGSTLGGAVAYAEHIFSGKGAIQLLTGHKAKGLEWDNVFHLDPWRIPSPFAEGEEELEQEANLRYVITTRARSALYEIDLDNIGD